MQDKNPDIWAWVGEDEYGTGNVGLKQARGPGGITALAAVDPQKLDVSPLREGLQEQANLYGKRIRLVRYVAVEEIVSLEPEEKK